MRQMAPAEVSPGPRVTLSFGGSATRGRSPLSAQELVHAALAAAGRGQFSDFSFFRSLECLVDACNREANLSALGARAVRVDLLRCLKNLLRFEAREAACPDVLSRPIKAPVFITGMPRSGTTFLHELIVQDPDTVAPRLFQLVYPDSAIKGVRSSLRKSWVRLQLMLFRLLTPQLNELHPIAVDAPEECTDITAQVFQSLRFESTYRVPSYQAWVRRAGFIDAYRFHRRFLQHLDARQPGRQWVLKSPDHVFALDDLRKVYPDARLIFVHRDPVRVIASVAKLTEALRRPFTRHIDRFEIGREVAAAWIDGAQRMIDLASTHVSILHLHYRDIVTRPLAAARALHEFCDRSFSAETESRTSHWLSACRPSGRQRHYDLKAFGLDAGLLREQFSSYMNRFGIETEPEGSEGSRIAT